MNNKVRAFIVAIVLCAVTGASRESSLGAADANADVTEEILALERKTMDGWLAGNPDSMLAVCDGDITLFHAVTNGRLSGLAAVRKLYESYRGAPLFDRYEMVDPKVQVSGNIALLTYVLEQYNAGTMTRWNGTQVYERTGQGWRVIHTHWSMTNPPRRATQP